MASCSREIIAMNGDLSKGICFARSELPDEFHCYQMTDVLSQNDLQELKTHAEQIEVENNISDLCLFKQSTDLDKLKPQDPRLNECIQKFLNFLKTTVREKVESYFRVHIRPSITATVSKYSKGDYLLCHDDRLGSRAVAFVFYLNQLDDLDGGSCRFFSAETKPLGALDPISGCYHHIVKPLENSLLLFRVNQNSYHEVEQIYSDTERLSINGWFHYLEPNSINDVTVVSSVSKCPFVNLQMEVNPILPHKQIMRAPFFRDRALAEMRVGFDESPHQIFAIENFLIEYFYESCVLELESIENWEVRGPANFRFYETVDFEDEYTHINFGESLYHINNLVDTLVSPSFLEMLTKITGIDYGVFLPNNKPPTCMIEVQRWKEGNYSLLCDNNVERRINTMEVQIFFKVNEALLGSADTETDLSGVVVQSVKDSGISRAIKREMKDKRLAKLKMLRKLHSSKSGKKGLHRKRNKLSKQQEEAMNNRLERVVAEKVDRLARYRNSRIKTETSYYVPRNNILLITVGSKDKMKYTSYIKKRFASPECHTCYYAVSITYVTT